MHGGIARATAEILKLRPTTNDLRRRWKLMRITWTPKPNPVQWVVFGSILRHRARRLSHSSVETGSSQISAQMAEALAQESIFRFSERALDFYAIRSNFQGKTYYKNKVIRRRIGTL